MEDDDLVEWTTCSDCAAEAPEDEQGNHPTDAQLQLEGWDFTGEYGPRCPECVAARPPIEPVEGLTALADILNAKPKEKK